MKHLSHTSETFTKTSKKILKKLLQNIYNVQIVTPKINTLATCFKKQMKHLEHMLATCVYNHCNICNIPIYFATSM